MSEWPVYRLDQVYTFSSGLSKKREEFGFGYPFLTFKDVFNNYFVPKELTNLANTTEKEQERCSIQKGDVFLTRTSETQDELGMSCVALDDFPNATFNGFTKRLRPNGKIVIIPKYAGYYFRSPKFRATISTMSSITTRASLNNAMLSDLTVIVPPMKIQKALAAVLSSLDDKIDLLHRQNKTLESLAQTIFRQWFIEAAEDDWEIRSIQEVVNVAIGRTPPRKEFHWFSYNRADMKWVSIKDLGNEGIFIFDTSEYLTRDAIEKFNIPVIPRDTVVLSFKMTVGRVGITVEEIASNEAIAHFKFRDDTPFVKEYLYFFLKLFKYQELGSTSSIVTSINSRMIKAMEISIPDTAIMNLFGNVAQSLFDKIRKNQAQISTLEDLRDSLLPKLLSGEVRVHL